MTEHETPELPTELARRIQLVRRDMGQLLFHFTRAPTDKWIRVEHDHGGVSHMSASASSVLRKILYDGTLLGTSRWTYGYNTVCFTEAPIYEFNYVFALIELASSKQERPRYEPYGIAVPKKWLFQQGGRPAIYDDPDAFRFYPKDLQYRFVPYDPSKGIDYTWEREWRIQTDALRLDPKHTLVVVPSSEEAFNLVYEMADMEADYDDESGAPTGAFHVAKWLAVSLDLFGFTPHGPSPDDKYKDLWGQFKAGTITGEQLAERIARELSQDEEGRSGS